MSFSPGSYTIYLKMLSNGNRSLTPPPVSADGSGFLELIAVTSFSLL